MKSVTIIFNKKMKMSELIDADYRLLLLLNNLNFSLGFGDKTVKEVCREYNFDPDCFLFIANYLSKKCVTDVTETEFENLPLEPFITYLAGSHEYFLDKRLPNIRRKLGLIFESSDNQKLQNIVLNFFDNYTKEVYDHMMYENDVVFPYINSLLKGNANSEYSIDVFEERHNDIENKMADLKQILLKYVSWSPDQMLMANVLMELYMSGEELEAHTFIEDELVIPRVKRIEKERLEK